jgi:hypothetical protein
MYRACFCLEKHHVGKTVIRIHGRRVRLGFRVREEDVGRGFFFTADRILQLSEIAVTADLYPCIHAICSSLNLNPVQHVVHRKYAIGDPEHEYEVTPWFATIIDLEKWCSRNSGAYFPQSRMVQ